MSKIFFLLIFLFSLSKVEAQKSNVSDLENFMEEEILGLDSEIEDFLEENEFDEEEINAELEQEEENVKMIHPMQEKTKSSLAVKNAPMEIQEVEEPLLDMNLDQVKIETEKILPSNPIEITKKEIAKSAKAIQINLKEVFSGAPIIYTILFLLSTVSLCIWLYSMMTIRSFEFLPPKLVKDLRTKLITNQFDEALDLCIKEKHFFCKMLASGILSRKHGLNVMIDSMKSEGKRSTIAFWQRIGILNEIAIIAPMLGLLGTVLGMFYAFYDLNRSLESVSLLFDGLGISVGTTVAGLIVAILAMILYSLAKYRLVRVLASVENEAQTFAALIDTRGSNYLNK